MLAKRRPKSYQLVGWCEWVSLPVLGIPHIQAKVDTGARTSALHAYRVDTFTENGIAKVSFDIHPFIDNTTDSITCIVPLHDTRVVTDSGGHSEERFVIKTPVRMGEAEWPIEITLTNRDNMNFRMLLGRTALHHRAYVDPSRKFLMAKKIKIDCPRQLSKGK